MSLILPYGLGRQETPITELQAQVLIEIEPILRAMRLHLVCPRCLAAGRTTEALVGGQNSPGDSTWSVSCPCTDRTFKRAAN